MSIVIRDVLGLFYQAETGFSLRETTVYVQAGKIAALDRPPADFTPGRSIDGRGKLLMPGLINTHTHSAMTILRNAANDCTFHHWLFHKIFPLEAKLREEDCYWGTQLGLMEMLSTGTTCFLDMYFFINGVAKAIYDAKGRAVLSRGLIGGAEDPEGGKIRLKEAREEVLQWRGVGNLDFMLAPHAPYTCDPDYQREIADLARTLGLGIHTHIGETQKEDQDIRATYGKSPVALMEETGLLALPTVAAHCVCLSDADMDILRDRGVTVAHNPSSNLKLACGIAPVPRLLEKGVNVSLGTDGTASNNTLNLFGELRLATLLHKGIALDPELVSAPQGLEMATINGARALGLEKSLGKIEVGFDADLTLLDLNRPNMQPATNPVAALAYSASGHEVVLTMVKGEILYENGEFPTIDAQRVFYEVEKTCKRIGV